jgi:hypothetical protein
LTLKVKSVFLVKRFFQCLKDMFHQLHANHAHKAIAVIAVAVQAADAIVQDHVTNFTLERCSRIIR